MKTSELTGAALDWAVAKCEGALWSGEGKPASYQLVTKDYSADWAHGGPIIGRERINLQFCRDLRNPHGLYIHACSDTNVNHGYWRGDHEHPLIAAMRCYVASKLGDEVDVPKELT